MESSKSKHKKKKSKKRKAVEDAATHDTPAPDNKKLKRSTTTVNETEEQWQKYVKQQSTPTTSGASNKKKTTDTSKKQQLQQQKKKKKKSNPLDKHREPCDLMRNEKRYNELMDQVVHVEEIDEAHSSQKALAVHVMPARDRQTAQTLALGDDNANHIVYNDVNLCMEMKRHHYERSRAIMGPEQALPLQDLMGEHGFFSINNEHDEQVMACIIKDKRNDINYIKHSQAEAANAASSSLALTTTTTRGNGKKRDGTSGPGGGDMVNKKLNYVFGDTFFSFRYNIRMTQQQEKKIKAEDEIDRERRLAEFYKFDALEPETNFGEIATNFKMMREIKRQNMGKFLHRNDTMQQTAALTPKTELEVVSKEYIAAFRQPPTDSEPLCANREQCVFNTFSRDKNVCYIGKVFFTEKEHLRDPTERNTDRLCYDCLIKKWTIEWALNIQQEVIPERPLNYFTVMCKPGQYGSDCLLKMVENDKCTGIIGNVPRFDSNKRHIETHVRHIKRDGKFHQISVPVLTEINMDF